MTRKPLRFEDVRRGEQLAPLRYVLTEEKVRQFRAAVQDPEAAFPNLAAKDYAYALWTTYETSLVINARHEAWYSRPPMIGETIIVSGNVADKYERRGRQFIVVETRSLGANGDEICRGQTTLMLGGVPVRD
jgi:hypothetical protein